MFKEKLQNRKYLIGTIHTCEINRLTFEMQEESFQISQWVSIRNDKTMTNENAKNRDHMKNEAEHISKHIEKPCHCTC